MSSIIEGERDENEVRKDFTASERVAIADAVKAALGEWRGGDRSLSNEQGGQLSPLTGGSPVT